MTRFPLLVIGCVASAQAADTREVVAARTTFVYDAHERGKRAAIGATPRHGTFAGTRWDRRYPLTIARSPDGIAIEQTGWLTDPKGNETKFPARWVLGRTYQMVERHHEVGRPTNIVQAEIVRTLDPGWAVPAMGTAGMTPRTPDLVLLAGIPIEGLNRSKALRTSRGLEVRNYGPKFKLATPFYGNPIDQIFEVEPDGAVRAYRAEYPEARFSKWNVRARVTAWRTYEGHRWPARVVHEHSDMRGRRPEIDATTEYVLKEIRPTRPGEADLTLPLGTQVVDFRRGPADPGLETYGRGPSNTYRWTGRLPDVSELKEKEGAPAAPFPWATYLPPALLVGAAGWSLARALRRRA